MTIYPTMPQQYGAIGNNVTDDVAAFNAAQTDLQNAGGGELCVPVTAAGYKLGGTMNVGSNLTLRGLGRATLNFTNATSGGDLVVSGACSKIQNLNINLPSSTQGIVFGTDGKDDFSIEDCTVVKPAASGIAIHFNISALITSPIGNKRAGVRRSVISGGNYGILFNNALVGRDFFVEDCEVYGQAVDGINFNVISAQVIPAGHYVSRCFARRCYVHDVGEFAFAIAAVQDWKLIDCHAKNTAQAAFHIEDGSTDGEISGCKAEGMATGKNGFQILKNTSYTSNRIRIHHSTALGGFTNGIGFIVITNAAGIATNVEMDNLLAENFATGFQVNGTDLSHHLHARNCTTGMIVLGFATGRISEVKLENVTTGFATTDGGTIGKVYFVGTPPTTIGTCTNGTLNIEEIAFEGSFTHAGTGAVATTIAPAPTNFTGTYEIRAYFDNALHRAEKSAYTLINGGTLTEVTGTPFTLSNGSLSAAGLSIAAGNLKLNTTYTGTAATVNYQVVFRGTWRV